MPLVEKAIVDKNGTLGVQFQYNISHIVGSTATNINANTASTIGNHYVRFKPNTSSTYTKLSSGSSAPVYTNQSYQTNYHQQSSPVANFTIELVRVTSTSGAVAVEDQTIIPVIFAASATLQVADEINAVVQGHTTQLSNLDGRVTTNTNNISSVT